MDSSTDNLLVREILADHYNNPRNCGTLDEVDFTGEARNPQCVGPGHEQGDRVKLVVRIEQEPDGDTSQVAALAFQGEGCVMSQAGASLFTKAARGESVQDVLQWGAEELQDLIGMELSATRLRCAELPLRCFREGYSEWASEGSHS